MPMVYWCPNCWLVLYVGFSHGFEEFIIYDLFVCAACGTQYLALWRMEEEVIEIQYQPAPLLVKSPGEMSSRKEWKTLCTKEYGFTYYNEVTCCYCGTKGRLTGEWSIEKECPHCHAQGMTELGGWIT